MPTGAERRISIIIPSRCDAAALKRTVDALTAVAGIERAEVIVAAWGDQAGTDRAVAGRARLLWPGGSTRAALMNAGAGAANGDVFFFLHADSQPPRDALRLIDDALADSRVVGGAFEHLFLEPSVSLRLITYIKPSPLPSHAELLRRPGDLRARFRLPGAWRLQGPRPHGGPGLQSAAEAPWPECPDS